MSAQDTTTTARALYGDGWHDLPEFVQDAAAGFVADLLDLTGTDIHNSDTSDRVSECAELQVPIYRSELLALLADVDTADRIMRAADEMGGVQDVQDVDGLCKLVAMGCFGFLSETFALLVWALERDGVAAFETLGLDADAAEVAVALLPEWSGTVRELVEAAPRLAGTLAVAR